ncbi:N-6 DNA methylase [Flavobacterium oreochromis]|uniref:type I restriction-modification system subunit M n=2 Tax=Flavobacterium oreochromis TaxID=2906078 RepID=UPI000B4DEDD2|nr:type I restriction-modification system subunit M [Flavobacterium oreochromis]OWP78353.1 DNA methyltransferase [Flavobacterium oreochromis]
MLQTNPILKALIDRLWNNFWSGGISNPLTAIEQITYLIFMKQMDDLEAKRERDAEFTGEAYDLKFVGMFKVPGSIDEVDKQDLRWRNFKRMPAEEMLLHVQTKVFPFLKEFEGGSKFTKAMANAVFIMPKPSLLVEAIKIIEEIFVEIEKDAVEGGHAFQDIQGDVYEMLLGEIASAGKNGQFRTPRHIIKLMNDLVQPQLGQRIVDPACGTAGFLLGAYQYILTDLVRKENPSALQPDEDGFMRATVSATLNENLKHIVEDSLYGYDIDTTMVRLGLMNLMMHGIDHPNIDYKDTLSKSYNEDAQFDIILANPPFTGNIDKGDINESLKLNTTKTELLFIERIYNMLKMGGTAAIVIPQGVLFGSGKAFVECRKIMVEKSELKAVISMPSGVFKPYAGVSTAILIFTKGSETNTVWFYDMQNDGYTLDDKRNKIENSDLQDIVKKYHNRIAIPSSDEEREATYFTIDKQEIVENNYDLSFSKYKKEVYEEASFEDPQVIFEKLEAIEENIMKGIKELKDLM